MLLSFKTALIPNNRQITAFRKASGVARHAYNWANAQVIDILATRKEGEKLKLQKKGTGNREQGANKKHSFAEFKAQSKKGIGSINRGNRGK